MGKHAFTVVVAVVIGVSLLVYLFSYQVRTNEKAVVLTFGKAAAESVAGWHFQWPWPVQEVRRFDNRLQVREGSLQEATTRDEHNIITAVCVGWRIGDVFTFNKNFGGARDPVDQSWPSLMSIVSAQTKAALGNYTLSDLVNQDPKKVKYDEIESKALRDAKEDALQSYGIDLVLLKIKRFELPERVKNNVYARMRQEREKKASSIREQGEEEARNIKAQAKAQSDEIRYRAIREGERLRADGHAEASKRYVVFSKNPKLAVFLRKVRALLEITAKNTTIITDPGTIPFDLLEGPGEAVDEPVE